MATPAEPRPRSSRICTNRPPREWPIRIGGASSERRNVLVVVGDLDDTEPVHDRRVLAEHLDLDVHAGPPGSEDAVAGLGVPVDPVLPAVRGEPEPVDEHDRALAPLGSSVLIAL
jgi:hypothetical protein